MSDWQQISLGDLETPVRRKVAIPPQDSRTSVSDGYPLRPLGEVMRLDIQRTPMKPETTYHLAGVLNAGKGVVAKGELDGGDTEYAAMNVLRAGQVVMRKLTAWEGPITVVPAEFDGFVVSNEFPTFTLGPELMPDWMRHVCRSPRLWAEMKNRVSGTVQRRKRLNPEQLLHIKLPIPPREVQAGIVEILDAVDDLVTALDAEGASLRSLLAGTRRKLESVEHKTTLVDLAEPRGVQIGPFGSQLHAHEYTEDPSGTPVVMPQDLVDGQILTTKIKRVPHDVAARLSRHRLAEGDIVFPRRGDLAKRALVVSAQDGWLCGTGCIRFRPQDSTLSRLLAEALSGAATTEWLVSHAVGTTMLNLNTEILSNLPVADIKGHHEIAEASLEVAEVIRRTQLQATRLRDVRAGLLSALLDRTIDIESDKQEV
ncbi:restriction endonuclease subunit S [Streptomyces atroolivaceus]|uniref:restriction endonuclease subunit S n=1 Tax=Streptomyces atroolivaceus TaxID=66869 RepID=UPI00342C9653